MRSLAEVEQIMIVAMTENVNLKLDGKDVKVRRGEGVPVATCRISS